METGRQVLVVPHDMRRDLTPLIDDRALCDMVALGISSPMARAVTTLASARDLKAMIGCCELVVGSRFHALVAALSQGIPVVAVGWAHKYPELLSEFSLEEYVFDARELKGSDLTDRVGEAWVNRHKNGNVLQDRVLEVRAAIAGVFDTVSARFLSRR